MTRVADRTAMGLAQCFVNGDMNSPVDRGVVRVNAHE